MRAFLGLLAGLLLVSPAAAQIHQLGLRSAKLEKKHAKLLVEIRGQRGLMVEALTPLVLRDGGFEIATDRLYEFFLQNPEDPASVPYRVRKGERIPVSRRRVLALRGAEIAFLVPVMELETFASLALEAGARRAELDSLLELRQSHEPGSEAWLSAHRRVLGGADRFGAWLRATGYTGAAEDLLAELRREEKRTGASLGSERLAAAWKSIHQEPVPESLLAADQELHRGRSGFQVLRSQHFRIVFERRVPAPQVAELLREAEAALEDFRLRQLDAWRPADEPDAIPEGLVLEFFFGPEDREAFEGFFVLHYGQSWGVDRERQLERRGRGFHQAFEPHFVEYWRYGKDTDLEGIVLHGLGHALAELAWTGHYGPVAHDWLREALGYRLEWERRGRNVIVCVGMPSAGRYLGPGEREGFGGAGGGTREWIRQQGLADPTPLPTLLLRQLHELSQENVAKAWHFFEWLQALPAGQGAAWLRELEDAGYQGPDGFLRRMRQVTAEGFGTTAGRDPLLQLEDRWRESALAGEQPAKR
ncbi:MAG: hypothetical protein ISR76_03155 [Planctomycetes bacterium]|nr:hypothetical protein [Planctomycetota bacterium]